MRVPKFGPLLATSVAAALVALTAPLAAQEAVIKGKVTSATGEPLGGASIVVANTNLGAVTAANGTYTLTIGANAAHGQQIVLTARYIGHKPITRTVALTGGEQQQDFQLAADPLRLEEVVVTGVAEATDRRKLPMTVATVGTDQLQRRRSDRSAQTADDSGDGRHGPAASRAGWDRAPGRRGQGGRCAADPEFGAARR